MAKKERDENAKPWRAWRTKPSYELLTRQIQFRTTEEEWERIRMFQPHTKWIRKAVMEALKQLEREAGIPVLDDLKARASSP